jgi:gentisate 1,2-dioxygenase
MELYTTAVAGGRDTYRVYTPGTNGLRRLPAVLLEPFHGAIYNTAYVSGERCRLYIPAIGEELNLLTLDVGTGTSETLTKTQIYTVATGSGKLIVGTGEEEWRPFIQLEDSLSVLATTGSLAHVMFMG